jgi:LCP family protein required for cell wall assembly
MRNIRNTTAGQPGRLPAQPPLTTSRSRLEARKLSRFNSVGGYAQKRQRRLRRKRILTSVGIALASVLVIAAVGVAAFMLIINNKLGTDLQGNRINFDTGIYENVFVVPEKPEDPFWVLLMGTDNRDGYEIPRTDTLILARVDQGSKTMAMISIPRDIYIELEGVPSKINSAFTWAEVEQEGSGVAATIQVVSQFAGVDIAYFAQVDFDGLVRLVDGLGGVEVDVPVDIIGDYDAGGIDIYQGVQILNGEKALVFCRSRQFDASDYQRQANQRTFLQALVKQVLAADPAKIATTVTNLAEMTYTNMDLGKIIKVAQGMSGIQESDIRTYTVPAANDKINEIDYEVANASAWHELIAAIERGEYPERQTDSHGGIVPDSYIADPASTTGQDSDAAGTASTVNPGDYTVEVRNGCGIAGSAKSVSDKLVAAGYRQNGVGDAQDTNYQTTLIIYQNETGRAAAQDIKQRLGYGNTISSGGTYAFTGDILVVVGRDFSR